MPNHPDDEARMEAMTAYPDDRPSRADLAEEAAWWNDWHKRTDEPPAGMEDRIVAALDRAVEKLEGER